MAESEGNPPVAPQLIACSQFGFHPIAGNGLSSHAHDMKPNQFSPGANPTTSKAQIQTAGPDLNHSKTDSPPAPDTVARRADTIYENQGSQPGHEVKHWLEAETQLFGGVERESQMHPGSSLFITEH